MPTSLSWLTKLGRSRGAYVVDSVQGTVDKVLDIGCSYGAALGSLSGKASELWGVDMDEVALTKARATYPNIKFIHQTATTLPFDSNMFDVVILSEVIEHVGEENKKVVIDEAWRVLKDNGLFIFTAPHEGVVAWADHLDFKRRFPGVYLVYMRLSKYTPDTPIEVGHKHLSIFEVHKLFEDRFQFENIQFCGFFMPFINWIMVLGDRLKILPRPIIAFLIRLQAWEGGVTYPQPLAFNLRLTARKKPCSLLKPTGNGL